MLAISPSINFNKNFPWPEGMRRVFGAENEKPDGFTLSARFHNLTGCRKRQIVDESHDRYQS
jgi:hypothetical protein